MTDKLRQAIDRMTRINDEANASYGRSLARIELLERALKTIEAMTKHYRRTPNEKMSEDMVSIDSIHGLAAHALKRSVTI